MVAMLAQAQWRLAGMKRPEGYTDHGWQWDGLRAHGSLGFGIWWIRMNPPWAEKSLTLQFGPWMLSWSQRKWQGAEA